MAALTRLQALSDGNMAVGRIGYMCEYRPLGKGLDHREELADLQDRGDLGDLYHRIERTLELRIIQLI